jgi:hypothetical protein
LETVLAAYSPNQQTSERIAVSVDRGANNGAILKLENREFSHCRLPFFCYCLLRYLELQFPLFGNYEPKKTQQLAAQLLLY